MHVEAFRRYLQPSTILRWHPWAPLAVLLLALAFTFWFGVKAGIGFAERRANADAYSLGVLEMMTQKDRIARPGRALVSRAATIDRAVMSFVRSEEQSRGFTRLLDSVIGGSWLSSSRASYWRQVRESTVKAAEWRLANFSPRAPAWQKTAAFCDELRDLSLPHPFDVANGYKHTAMAYTKLLGRRITPAELAPAVPGGTCN
jgi:hypothetical protein